MLGDPGRCAAVGRNPPDSHPDPLSAHGRLGLAQFQREVNVAKMEESATQSSQESQGQLDPISTSPFSRKVIFGQFHGLAKLLCARCVLEEPTQDRNIVILNGESICLNHLSRSNQ